MSPIDRIQTPNEVLAGLIAEALHRAGHVPAEVLDELQQKLAAGTAREADWHTWITAAPPEPRGEDPFG
jgi:hypothetical protein